ncbi:MAG: hypothetical protein FD170_1599 [Bacteroidetes bacterium]|nr:MAG: hypothetical protein FD170_1599 [Bacteroidota bacterium]
MKELRLKQFVPHLVVVLIILVVILAYFSPVLEGKRLKQSDITQWKGMSKEITDFREKTGEEALWTNSMFGGMPAYQISVQYNGNLIRYIDDIFKFGLPHPANLVFIYFIGFFILLMVLKVDPWLAMAGALAFTFSSYFFIILEAGHNSKAHAIGYMAPVLAGILLTFRGKYIAGALLTALFLALELRANHLQITYYLAMMVVALGIFELISAVKTKTLPAFAKATGLLVVAALFALSTNITNIWATWEYGKETIRGKSELTTNPENRTSGLDKDYATQWSYGVGETFSLLIPNTKGGASGSLGNNEKAMEKVDAVYAQSLAGQNQYWGDQPFTSGPVYTGAIMVFMFVLGLFILKGNLKWWILTATLLSILLSWGRNFMPLTDFFLHYLPGYNKFRAVSMILVIADLAIPLLGILALKEIIEKPQILRDKQKFFYISLGLTGGLALIFYIMPQVFFSFLSGLEQSAIAEQRMSTPAEQLTQFDALIYNLELARISIFKADAIRSVLFIAIAAALLWLYSRGRVNRLIVTAGIIVLIAADMIPIAHRYLNNDNFVSKSLVNNPYQPTEANKLIMKDTDPNFRVFNMTVSTFQEGSTSYFHKSIGGYHGAKLRRYQELIENHLSKRNDQVLNMLNTKYFIGMGQDRQPVVQINMGALGHAWFVEEHEIVANADEEIAALTAFFPEKTAIIDQRFSANLEGFRHAVDSNARIELTEYQPNKLKYSSQAASDQLAVFSEIYYDKGWNAYLDGEKVPHFRVNYVLRAMVVPAGNHEIEFRFEPKVFAVGEKVSFAGSLLLILMLVGFAATELWKKLKSDKTPAK